MIDYPYTYSTFRVTYSTFRVSTTPTSVATVIMLRVCFYIDSQLVDYPTATLCSRSVDYPSPTLKPYAALVDYPYTCSTAPTWTF